VLAVLCFAQLILLLDFSIVNVALPRIQSGLGFSANGVQWVVSAYALAYGGLLLLGGRLSDILERRLVLQGALALFGLSSLLAGLVQEPALLVAARVLQGAGAALAAPAILSLITTGFAEGAQRNRALGWFSAASAAGFALGVLLGGVLTQTAGWRSVFFVNVPIVAAIMVGGRRLLAPSNTPSAGRRYDLPGAVLSTSGSAMVIYGLSQVSRPGPAAAWWIGAGTLALGAFVLAEKRAQDPLVPLSILRLRTVSVANAASVLVPGVIGAVVLQLSLYLQQVQGRSALTTGLAFLPLGAIVFLAGPLAAVLSGRIGAKPVCAAGALLVSLGVALLIRTSAHTGYPSLLPGLLVTGAGFAAFFATAAITATQGIPDGQQGLAGALLNTAQQIGTALGIAVLLTVAATGSDTTATRTTGLHRALLCGAAVALATALLVALGLPKAATPQPLTAGPSPQTPARLPAGPSGPS